MGHVQVLLDGDLEARAREWRTELVGDAVDSVSWLAESVEDGG